MTSIYPQRVRFGPFEADLETHELWKNGVKLKLGGQPFEILALLLNRPGQMVSREELQKEIWTADTFVDFNHGLNAAVNKLRETLSDSAEEPKYIETLPRRGYRFIGTIENAVSEVKLTMVPVNPEVVPPATPVIALAQTASTVHTFTGQKARVSTRRRLAAWVFVTAVLAGSTLIVHRWWESRGAEIKEGRERLGEARALSNTLTLVPDPASDPAISPDGKMVAFRRNSYAPAAAGIFVTSSYGKALTQLTQHPGDCCPAWSPDGKMIAFSRIATDEYGIYVVEARGGAPRKISHEDPRKKRGELAWTADGNFIAFSGDSPKGGAQIFLVSVNDSSVRPLSEPQGQDRDWGPSFSPDGTQMAFVRTSGAGFPEEIFVMPANGGAARLLTYDRAAIMGPPAWSEDGTSIIFSSTREGDPTLWKILASGGTAARIEGTGTGTWHPSVARQGGKMAAQKILGSSGIYRVSLEEGTGKWAQTIVTSTNGRNEGPRVSPDGKRLVFMSDRSGSLEIWASNRDGSDTTQLTNLHGCGTPRWSPDGLSVAFDTTGNGPHAVWVISALGGTPRALVKDQFDNVVASWSHDGKWIYFGSNRSGQDEVWKIPAEGGRAVRVTQYGGFAALESPDGTALYYAKTRYENPELWQIPTAGGNESRFPGVAHAKSWAAWSVTNRGIFYCPPEEANRSASIDFYDFETHLTRQVSLLDRSPFWLSATPDGREVLYDQAEQDESSVVLVQARP